MTEERGDFGEISLRSLCMAENCIVQALHILCNRVVLQDVPDFDDIVACLASLGRALDEFERAHRAFRAHVAAVKRVSDDDGSDLKHPEKLFRSNKSAFAEKIVSAIDILTYSHSEFVELDRDDLLNAISLLGESLYCVMEVERCVAMKLGRAVAALPSRE